MLRKILIASSLLLASGSALALDEFISKPRVSITFGGGHHDYDHHDQYREVYVPRPVHVQPIYYQPVYSNNYYRGNSRGHHGWSQRDAHHDEWREHRQHKRHHRKHHDEHDD